MTADSVIPDADDSQSYNRYSYVFNNPLTLTDPDGHCPVCIAIIAVAGGAAVSAAMTVSIYAAIAVGAVFGAMSAGVASDGDPRAMLQGAVIGGIMAGIGFQMTQGGAEGLAATTHADKTSTIYAQTAQSTITDVPAATPMEVIGVRTWADRLYSGAANYGSAIASTANALYTAINQNPIASVAAGFVPGYTLLQAVTAPQLSYSAVALGVIDAFPGAGKIASIGIKGFSRGLEHIGGKALGKYEVGSFEELAGRSVKGDGLDMILSSFH